MQGAAPPQLGGLTVAQLRELCEKHGLPKTGVKADLLARLREKLCSDGPPVKKQKMEVPPRAKHKLHATTAHRSSTRQHARGMQATRRLECAGKRRKAAAWLQCRRGTQKIRATFESPRPAQAALCWLPSALG